MADDRVRATLSDHLADEVEVVVLQHHDRFAAALLHLVGDRVGELPVDRDIAVREGAVLVLVDVGRSGEAVKAVLHEPQQRVGDLAVEHAVLVGVDLDVTHRQRRTHRLFVLRHHLWLGGELDLDRVALVLGRDGRIGFGRGRADPHGVVEVLGQPHQRRHQASCAALGGDPATRPAEGGRTAMGEQNDRQHALYLA